MSSDDDSDGIPPPPPPNLGSTGAFPRLDTTGKYCVSVSRSPMGSMSIGQSPTSPQSSFRWDRGQSFRVYPMSRRGTQGTLGETFGSEGFSRSAAEISPAGSPVHTSCASRIKSAYSGLRNHLAAHAHPISGSSTIRKGRLIASGGYASVFSGLDSANNEIIAIKELLIGPSDTAASFKDIEDEFALIRKLKHENVVRYKFFDYSHSQRKCRIVLEFLSGGSTQAIQKRFGPIREPMLKKLARDIFRGLSFIHEEGILHRDIKPANILVSARGVAKLADFGCSKKISEVSSATNHLLGTPIYMSPEFIKGNMHKKADIWSAGCTLFELATGCQPWHHTRIRDHLPLMFYITTTSESPLVLPKMFDRTFSEDFADFLERCFERTLDKRPDARVLLDHPWLTQVSAADVEGQQSLEEMCADMCTELCEFLSSERDSSNDLAVPATIGDVAAVSTSRTPPEASLSHSVTKRTSVSSVADSPRASRSPCHSVNHSRFESNFSEIISGAFEADDVGVQQFFVLNEDKNTFEIVTAKDAGDADISAVPVMSLESTMAVSSLTMGAAGVGDQLNYEPTVSPKNDSDPLPSRGPSPTNSFAQSPVTPSLTPTNFTDGPRQVNVSFSQGRGRRVKLGLTVEPSDVSVRLIDKKASFVLSMNNKIRAQIASAFADHSSGGDDDDKGNEADDDRGNGADDDKGNDADDDCDDCDEHIKRAESECSGAGSPMVGPSTPRPQTGNESFGSHGQVSQGSRSFLVPRSITRTRSRLRVYDGEGAEDEHVFVKHLSKRGTLGDDEDDAHYKSFSSAVAIHSHGNASVSSNTPMVNIGIGVVGSSSNTNGRAFTPQRVCSDDAFSLHNSPSRVNNSRSVSPSFIGEFGSSRDAVKRIQRPVARQIAKEDEALPAEISHSPANSSDTERAPSSASSS